MLPTAQRLTSGQSFRVAVRRGDRIGTTTMVLHLLTLDSEARAGGAVTHTQVGFIVSKAVGSAVVRNRVKRRLRHLVRDRLELLPDSAVLVIRALPASAAATGLQLSSDLDRGLGRLKARSRRAAVPS